MLSTRDIRNGKGIMGPESGLLKGGFRVLPDFDYGWAERLPRDCHEVGHAEIIDNDEMAMPNAVTGARNKRLL